MREVERGWQPSVRSVRPGTLQAVSPRKAERENGIHFIPGLLQVNCDRVAPQLLSISTSSLLPSPPFFLPPLSLLLAAVCLCVLCMKRAGKKNREESGGRVASAYNRLPGDSIKHNEFPEASIPWFIVWIHLFTYIQDLLAIKCLNETVCFMDSALNAEHPFRYRGYIRSWLSSL